MNDIRVVAVISAIQPDEFDPTIGGDNKTVKVHHLKSKSAAVRWVKNELKNPIPEGSLAIYGYCFVEEYDEHYYSWLAVEESDSIALGDTLPTKWWRCS